MALDGAATEGGEESFAGPGGVGGTDALAARWRRLTQHFDDFVQVPRSLSPFPRTNTLRHFIMFQTAAVHFIGYEQNVRSVSRWSYLT